MRRGLHDNRGGSVHNKFGIHLKLHTLLRFDL